MLKTARWPALSAFAATALWGHHALAGCDIPFQVVTEAINVVRQVAIECDGPWFRMSSCVDLTFPTTTPRQFYCAEDNVFSPYAGWRCQIRQGPGGCGDPWSTIDFCLEKGNPNPVIITVSGDLLRMNVNAPICNRPGGNNLRQTAAVLGHTPAGEGAAVATASAAAPRGQLDTDTFAGRARAGGQLEVRVERDGAAGGIGERARVRVLGEGDRVLGQDDGGLPLRVRATVPASGAFRVEVGEGGGARAFRGHYLVTANAPGMPQDRTLEPQRDVEH